MNYLNPYQPKTNLEWIFVQTVDQVDSVPVQPGQRAWVMVQNEPIFALRTANAMGMATTELYKFEKYEPSTAPAYITADQLNASIQAMEERLNESISTLVDRANPGNSERNGRKGKTDESSN